METKLDFLYAFGSMGYRDIKGVVSLTETNCIVYPVGRHIAVKDLETHDIDLIREPSRVTRVTAMALSPEKARRFLAVGEYVEEQSTPLVSVFDLKSGAYFKRMRELGSSEIVNVEFTSISFSSDSRLITVLTGAPDYTGLVWDWYSQKLIAKHSFGSKVTNLTISPEDAYCLCSSGQNHWRIWKVEEKAFKGQNPFSGIDRTQNYLDHDWINQNTIIAISDGGETYVVRHFEVIQIIGNAFGRGVDASLTVVKCTSKGFFVGSSSGVVAYWAKRSVHESAQLDSFKFEFLRSFSTGRNSSINCLALSECGNKLAFCHKNNDIGLSNISEITNEELEVPTEVFCSGFHEGPISGMDVAVQRPLLVTCSYSDSSVRIWNYTTFKCEVAKKLSMEKETTGDVVNRPILSVAFHPSGYYLAIGFEDKVRIYHVLFEDLKFFRELNIKNATSLRFSNGGNFLAAGAYKVVYVYTCYTLENIHMLKIHTSAVNEVGWSSDDQKLVSVGQDGGVYVFDMFTGVREPEHVSRNTEFTSVTFLENDMVVAAGSESNHSFILEQNSSDWIVHKVSEGVKVSQVHYFKSFHGLPCFLGGSQSGSIQLFGEVPSECFAEEIVAHLGPVRKIRNSHDGRFVFSAGSDGVVFIYHLIEPRDQLVKEEDLTRVVDEALAEVVMVPRSQLDLFKVEEDNIKQQIENLRQKTDYSVKQREINFEDKRKEIEEELLEEYNQLESDYEILKNEKTNSEKRWVDKITNLKKAHSSAIEHTENLYEKKLNLEEEKYLSLEVEKAQLKKTYEDQITVLQSQNEEAVENLASVFKESLKKVQDDYEDTKKTADHLKLVYEERLSQQEEEHETEIKEIKAKFDKEIEERSSDNIKLRRDIEIITKEQQTFIEEKETLEKKARKKKSTIKNIQETKNELLKTKENLEGEKEELEERLIQIQNQLNEYKSDIRGLDKKKQVLDAKKKETLEEIQPKDQEINELKEELKKLHYECDYEIKHNEELQKRKEDLEQMLEKHRKEGANLKSNTQNKQRELRSMTNEIYNIVKEGEPKSWIEGMKKLYLKYVKHELNKVNKKDPQCLNEMEEQLQFMEKSINYLKHNQAQTVQRTKTDLQKRTTENSELIQELHKLREEHEFKAKEIKDRENQLKSMQQAIAANQRLEKMNRNTSSVSIARNTNPLPVPRPNTAKSRAAQSGKIYKGPTFESKIVALQDKQRIAELVKDLEERKQENFYLRMEVNKLRDDLEGGSSNLEY